MVHCLCVLFGVMKHRTAHTALLVDANVM